MSGGWVPITAIITNTGASPTHFVVCPVCGGRVGFNLEEIRALGTRSVYCAGRETRTTGGGDPHNHWHPGDVLTNAGEIRAFDWG
ncbi:MAG: hypothetical protein ACREB9_02710 [Thermoplasmata archaeon]